LKGFDVRKAKGFVPDFDDELKILNGKWVNFFVS
jgi:hypothetical protein